VEVLAILLIAEGLSIAEQQLIRERFGRFGPHWLRNSEVKGGKSATMITFKRIAISNLFFAGILKERS